MSGICFQVTWGLGGDALDSCWRELTGRSTGSSYCSFKFCMCLNIFTVQYSVNNKTYKQGSVLDSSRLPDARALTSFRGVILVSENEEVQQGTRACPARLVQPNQLQAWSGHGREAVELEGEIHGLWPRRSLAVLGHSESNKSPQLIK